MADIAPAQRVVTFSNEGSDSSRCSSSSSSPIGQQATSSPGHRHAAVPPRVLRGATTESEVKPVPSLFQTIGKPILAGALTGGIEAFIMYPTEYIKTHLQLQDKKNPRYLGVVDCFRKTVNEAGIFGLYRGMMPLIIGSIPKQASRWGSYEVSCNGMLEVKRKVFGIPASQGLSKKDLSMAEVSVCGFIAGSVEALVAVVPTETVKTVLIDDQKRGTHARFTGRSTWFVVSTLIREEGVRGVYRGVSNTVMKQGLNQSTRFPSQLFALDLMCGADTKRRKHPFYNGVAGFFAGVFSVFVTQPFDVVKTKLQGVDRHMYRSSCDCWMQIARRNGIGHFYSGSVARMVRVGGNVALTFSLFPLIKELL